MQVSMWGWIAFLIFVAFLLVLDLGVFNRKAHVVRMREALWLSAFWIGLGLLFNLLVWWQGGRQAGLEFFAGFLIEKSLSVDNLFVFLMLFRYFSVPPQYQHRVLFWGIIGAIVMRGLFIFAGVALLDRFEWVMYIFGAVLIWSAWKMGSQTEHEIHPEHNPVLRLVRRMVPVTNQYEGAHLFKRVNGKIMATPLFIVIVAIEITDVIFAIDSIPAILGITRDLFIVFTSNVFAILGLRALYFALAGVMDLFRFLDKGLCLVLLFIGVKMLAHEWVHIPIGISLGVIATILAVTIGFSIWHARHYGTTRDEALEDKMPQPEPKQSGE